MNRLLEKLNNISQPILVPIKTEDYSTINGCFYNVIEKVSIDQGQIIYGWKLHKSSFWEEAERHAVWKSPNGELIDITPDPAYKDKIIFLEEDKGWTYDGSYIDNVRVNTTNNPLVDDLILLCETITKLWQTGQRKSKEEVMILEPVAKTIEFLNEDKVNREIFIHTNNNLESFCYCGQPAKYKDCHGYDLKKGYDELMNRINEIVINNTSIYAS